MLRRIAAVSLLLLTCSYCTLFAQEKSALDTSRGDKMIADYFAAETARLTERTFEGIETLEDWEARKGAYRAQLFEMLGLDPLPEKTPLKPVITGTVETHPEIIVENLHFQSRPGLYVTGNLYRPREVDEKLPAILYVCGHGGVKKDGVIYGNKVHYQHHGAWFARNGYVCLTIDTLQLGEIEGIHHGTYNKGMFWWNSRGYSSAAVEAWNCIRALDYLQSRDEVDPERLGVTGRSGGGAYSWWIASLDERIKAAVPVAGITSLHNHVVDGCVEGHCDCMYMVNTYGWDFPIVSALVAPRPLLISNSDKDRIFPLDGVVDVYFKTRKIYSLYGETDKLGLQITEGPHSDTQELRIHAFHWMNKYLKGEDPLIEMAAVKFFEPEQLKVFETIPEDQINTEIQESFTNLADPAPIESGDNWTATALAWKDQLRKKSFRGWPEAVDADELEIDRLKLTPAFDVTKSGVRFAAWDFQSQEEIELRLYLATPEKTETNELDLVVMNVLDESGWQDFLAQYRVAFAEQLNEETLPDANPDEFAQTQKMFAKLKWGMAYVAPRGIGPTAWDQSERKQTQHRRRFQLLGQTFDGMRVWDIRQAIGALQSLPQSPQQIWLQAEGDMACNALYASLFEPHVYRLDLWDLPTSHRNGPDYLNVLRIMDIPQAVTLAAALHQVRIYSDEPEGWKYATDSVKAIGKDQKQLQIRSLPEDQ